MTQIRCQITFFLMILFLFFNSLNFLGVAHAAPSISVSSNVRLSNNTTSSSRNRTWGTNTRAKSVTKSKMILLKNRKTNINVGRPLTCGHFSSDVLIPLKDASIGKHHFKAGEEALLKLKIEQRLECAGQHLSISAPPCFKIYNKGVSASGRDLIWMIGASRNWNFKLKASSTCRKKVNHKQYVRINFAHQLKKVEVVWSKPFVAPTIYRKAVPSINKPH